MKKNVSFAFKTKLSDSGLATFAINVLTRMKGNPRFASIQTPLLDTDLPGAIERYNRALQEAADGGRTKISEKRVAHDALIQMLEVVANHVNIIALGDETILLDSGFGIRQHITSSIAELQQVQGLQISQAGASADVVLTYDRVPHARFYSVEWSLDGGQTWINGVHSTALRSVVKGLPARVDVLFRVTAMGSGQRRGIPSDAVRFFVL